MNWLMSLPKWNKIPTGQLKIELSAKGFGSSSIKDTPQKPLEKRLNQILINLYKASAKVTALKKQIIIDKQKQDEEIKAEFELQRLNEMNKRRFELLYNSTNKFLETTNLRNFLKAIEDKMAILEKLPSEN